MTNRMRTEAERVAALLPPSVRAAFLDYSAALADAVNGLSLGQEEIRRLIAAQNSAAAIGIATGFEAYSAGEELRRGAHEAHEDAQIAQVREDLVRLALQRVEDMERLRQQMNERHAEVLAAVARVAGRQTRQGKHDQEANQ